MRWKLMAGNVAALLVVCVLGWLIVRSQVADALVRDADGSVSRAVGLFRAVRTAEGERLTAEVAAGARSTDVANILAMTSESDQRRAAFEYAQRFATDLGTRFPVHNPQPADVVALVNADGRVIARNVDRESDRNRDLRAEFESVAAALEGAGHTTHDMIKYDNQKWYDVVMVPVTAEGHVRGLLLVGYELADNIAREDRDRLGIEVGYLIREGNSFRLHSLSFGTQSDKDELLRWANGTDANLLHVFAGDSSSPVRDVLIGGQNYRSASAGMPGLFRRTRQGESRPGFVVLFNTTAARAPSTGTTLPILYFALAGLLVIALYNVMLGNYLERPIEQIEEGLLRIINGDHDHRIDVQHAELGGIVYRINQLVAELTGADETDDSGRISHPPPPMRSEPTPAAGAPLIDEAGITTPTADDMAASTRLGAEPENEYYDRLRREYVAARQSAGLGADGLSHEQFVESVRSSEQTLAQKYAVTLVRFTVVSQGNQVVFRAVGIR